MRSGKGGGSDGGVSTHRDTGLILAQETHRTAPGRGLSSSQQVTNFRVRSISEVWAILTGIVGCRSSLFWMKPSEGI